MITTEQGRSSFTWTHSLDLVAGALVEMGKEATTARNWAERLSTFSEDPPVRQILRPGNKVRIELRKIGETLDLIFDQIHLGICYKSGFLNQRHETCSEAIGIQIVEGVGGVSCLEFAFSGGNYLLITPNLRERSLSISETKVKGVPVNEIPPRPSSEHFIG